jgi:hypothetical protein
MTFDQYTRVMLLTDRFQHEGLVKGNIGYIIEVYAEGVYEVEFSDANGITIAQIVVSEAEIQLAD